VGNITSAVAEIDPGRVQVTQAPIKSYNMDNTELMGIPLFSDEPRTKSERCTKVYIGRIPLGISDYFIE